MGVDRARRWVRWAHDDPRLAPVVGATLMVFAVIALLLFGVIGIGRTTYRYGEFTAVYAAGRVWLAGGSPYAAGQFAPVIQSFGVTSHPAPVFAYSPAAAPFALAVATLSLPAARIVLLLANLIAAAVLACLMAWFPWDPGPTPVRHGSRLTPWLLASLMISNPFTMKGIYLGQNTLLVAAALTGAWWQARRGAWLGSGVLLGLCSVKPPIAVPLAVWFALEGRWKQLGTAAAVALLLLAYPLALDGIGPTLEGWRGALARYSAEPPNLFGDAGVVGLPSLLAAWKLPAPSLFGAWLGAIALTGLLWMARARFSSSDVFCLLIGLPVVLVFGHPYDAVLLVPLLAALWLHLADRRTLWPTWAVLLIALILPDRLTARFGAPQGQWVTLVAIPLMVWVLVLGYRAGRRHERLLVPADS